MRQQNQDLVNKIQAALAERGLAAWLFYGFFDLDPIAYRILRFPERVHASRRWFYLVPVQGEPRKLVHRIEASQLDHLPGERTVYLARDELNTGLKKLLSGIPQVAMQYSENNAIPHLSRVDAGTVEWVRSLGVEVVSSGDLVQTFEAVWTEGQAQQHRETAQHLTTIVQQTFQQVRDRLTAGENVTELSTQAAILKEFEQLGLEWEHPPIVGVNEHSGNPHYSPTPETDAPIRDGDLLLIDLWAKPATPADAVYADITWTAFFGAHPPQEMNRVFNIVRSARERGVRFLRDRLQAGRNVHGWEVDYAVRDVIAEAGYGDAFVHRTGHNLGREVHGNGVHFDNLETHDTRLVIPGIACTIEPGIYLEAFGVRSEINILVGQDSVEVTTPPQQELKF